MPDGFDPGFELAKIATLRDMMVACRERLPKILAVLDEAFASDDMYVKLKAMEFASDRGFGKPRQQVTITDVTENKGPQLYIPDNGRSIRDGTIIDAEPEGRGLDPKLAEPE